MDSSIFLEIIIKYGQGCKLINYCSIGLLFTVREVIMFVDFEQILDKLLTPNQNCLNIVIQLM